MATKPLPERMMTSLQQSSVALTRKQLIIEKVFETSIFDMNLKISHLSLEPHLPGVSKIIFFAIKHQAITRIKGDDLSLWLNNWHQFYVKCLR